SEQVLCHSIIGLKSDSKPYSFIDPKPFKNKEKPPDSVGLNAEGFVKDDMNRVMHDIKGNDGDTDPMLYLEKTGDGWPASKLDCSMSDKFLFDSGVDKKSDCNFLPSEEDQDSKLLKEKSESDISMQAGSMYPEENQMDKDIDNERDSNKKTISDKCTQDISSSLEETEPKIRIPSQCDTEDLILSRKMTDDTTKMARDDVSKELFTLGELLSVPEFSTVKPKAMSSNCKSDGIKQQCFQNSKEKEVMVMPPLVSADKESDNSCKETILSASAPVSVAEEMDSRKGEATMFSPVTSSSLVNEVSDDSKLAARNIAFGFDSSALTSSKDEGCDNLDREALETGHTPKLEDIADQPSSNNLQCGNGESSFSAAGLVTGLISYSGPIAYSGSLSHRSDSSTTSTRSFAFPILQSEWNSSPVRMAKADRRHYRKHRGWRQGLLCCRF
ncbi:hypothetical protein Goari_020420, partial [Gossypium aridum]|nr:hypothetical protein [Gossypium aridum]